MNRNDKLLLSADTKYAYGFKHGLFVRLYEQSLYGFIYGVKPLKPMLERVKAGDPVFTALRTHGMGASMTFLSPRRPRRRPGISQSGFGKQRETPERAGFKVQR